MALGPGARLDVYEIAGPLDVGGMGEVWLAHDTNLGRKVAIKLLPADLSGDATRVARFQQEARLASSLNHPNICTIHALGAMPDGRQFIAMEFIEGVTLRRRLVGARLALREVLDIATQVASALTAAHAAGVVHRDLKPENVMLRPDSVVKVLDFGLAKFAPAGPVASTEPTRTILRTDDGIVMGTVAYMSPEQVRAQDVDARTDVWSLGAVLYEALAERRPFDGPSNSDVIARILEREPDRLARLAPDTPPELQRIVGKALRKDRDQRYQSMKDLLLDVQALREDVAQQARSSSDEHDSAAPTTMPTPISDSALPAITPPHQSRAGDVVTGLARHKIAAAIITCVLALSLGGAWWALRTRPRGNDVVRSVAPIHRPLTRLTSGPGLQTDVTWSPDGRFIAYASDRAGNFDIWVQPVGGGNAVQVTRSPAQDTQPDWSPDGSSLVFRSERNGGGLFLVPALGGVERQLTTMGSQPFWSSNGKEILFVDAAALGDSESSARLYAVSPESGAPHEMLADFLRGGGWSWIAPHPDGRISAIGEHRQLGRGFFTIARDGTRLVQSKLSPDFPLPAFSGGPWVRRRFRWDPSGASLFVQALSNGVFNLWKVNVDPNTLAWVTAERLTTGAGPDVTPALSRDGTRVAFTSELGSTRLWVYPLDPVARRLGVGEPLTEDDAAASASDISPDGRYVAYNLERRGIERLELWITDMATRTSELVATNHAGGPIWSPDGTTLAYLYLQLDKLPSTSAVAFRKLNGKEQFISRWMIDTFFPTDWNAHVGLLGTYLSRDGRGSLALWPLTNPDADKPMRVLISRENATLWQGKVAPNGRWLSFIAAYDQPRKENAIVVAPLGGARLDQVEIAPGYSGRDKPRWAPDGRTLYFISRRPSSFYNLWAIRFDPERGTPLGQPFALTHFDSPSLAMSPDITTAEMDVSSRQAVLTMKTVSGSIWMLDNVDK